MILWFFGLNSWHTFAGSALPCAPKVSDREKTDAECAAGELSAPVTACNNHSGLWASFRSNEKLFVGNTSPSPA